MSQLKVLTQNAWAHYFATPIGQWNGVEGIASPVMSGINYIDRLNQLAEHIQKEQFDVVLLQEVFIAKFGLITIDNNFNQFTEKMLNCGLIYHTNPYESLGYVYGQNSGLVIYSKYKLNNEQFHSFQSSGEGLNSKGIVSALIILNDIQVLLLSTHLDSRDREHKINQLTEIRQFIKQQTSNSISRIIIGGDFNICPQVYHQGGYDDGTLYKTLVNDMKFNHLISAFDYEEEDYPITEGSATLDHFFISEDGLVVIDKKPVRFTNDIGESVSDHLGLAVTIKITDSHRSQTQMHADDRRIN